MYLRCGERTGGDEASPAVSESEKDDRPRDPEVLRSDRAARRTLPLRVEDQPEWRRLSDAIRRQIAAAVELDASRAQLAELAERAEALAVELERSAAGKRLALVDSSWQNVGGTMAYIPFSPVMGRLNPASIGIEIRQEGSDKVVAEVVLGEVCEGAGGLVHGGVIAAIYDEILASSNMLTKAGGPTGTLTVRYRRPTPLYTPLRFEAWVERVAERKVLTRGHCLVGDTVVSEADAVFVRFSAERQLPGWAPPEAGKG
jgi:acyl-coenzyme A thioesterase PaaI-like protein